jgi:hypothetical protein
MREASPHQLDNMTRNLERREKTDRYLIVFGFAFLGLICAYIVERNVNKFMADPEVYAWMMLDKAKEMWNRLVIN